MVKYDDCGRCFSGKIIDGFCTNEKCSRSKKAIESKKKKKSKASVKKDVKSESENK